MRKDTYKLTVWLAIFSQLITARLSTHNMSIFILNAKIMSKWLSFIINKFQFSVYPSLLPINTFYKTPFLFWYWDGFNCFGPNLRRYEHYKTNVGSHWCNCYVFSSLHHSFLCRSRFRDFSYINIYLCLENIVLYFYNFMSYVNLWTNFTDSIYKYQIS